MGITSTPARPQRLMPVMATVPYIHTSERDCSSSLSLSSRCTFADSWEFVEIINSIRCGQRSAMFWLFITVKLNNVSDPYCVVALVRFVVAACCVPSDKSISCNRVRFMVLKLCSIELIAVFRKLFSIFRVSWSPPLCALITMQLQNHTRGRTKICFILYLDLIVDWEKIWNYIFYLSEFMFTCVFHFIYQKSKKLWEKKKTWNSKRKWFTTELLSSPLIVRFLCSSCWA